MNGKIEYGLQLYSIRDISMNMPRALRRVFDVGYRKVEFAGLFGYSPEYIRELLDSIGLTAVGTHTGMGELAPERIENTLKTHLALGCKHITVPGARWSSERDFENNISLLNEAYSFFGREGIELGYHNHSAEFFMTPWGKTVEDEIIKNTDVNLEIDTFWLYNAGIDPVEYIQAHKDRIKLIHLKDGFSKRGKGADFYNSNNGADGRSLGQGECPIEKIVKLSLALGLEMIVESEDLAPTGIIEVQRCIDYLRSIE